MKKIAMALVLLVLIATAYLAVAGKKTQIIRTEISIAAPPAEVWKILTDIESWHVWNPTVNASSGEASVGADLTMTMMSEQAGVDGPKYSPKIIQLDEPNTFRWRAHMMASFIFSNEKLIELEKTESGTKMVHTETFKGIMAALMRGSMENGVTPILNRMNEALKELAEQ